MAVTETLNEGLKRAYQLIITAQDLEAKVSEKLTEAQPEIEMKGFRKGKVPLPLLRKQFGQRLLGEAMQESIDAVMNAHFEATGHRPAMQPAVKMTDENWKEGDDVHVELSYETLPDVPAVEFAALKLERMVVKAGDAEIDDALKSLADNAQSFEDRKKGSKAKDGDQVVLDFVGRIDGEAFEGGAAEDFPLVLGSGQFIPGFEEQLVGVKEGDEKDVTVSFPAEYGAAELAGKEAVFACIVKSVKAPKASEIDDELAKRYGAEDLAALKAQVTERLEAEYKGAARAVIKRALLDQLDETVSFELPPSLVKAEANQIAHQLWHEEHPEEHGHDHAEVELTDEHTRLAERRVKLGLLLAEIGRDAKVEVTDAEMTQAIMNQARQYPGQERAFFDFVNQNAEVRQQIQAPIFEDKVVDHIFEQANVAEKEVTKEDLEKAIESLDEA
ncbi:MAG: trigger factor [Rhodobacterales bacterium CG2_30_65_12]|nr:MAG: trigger factor [Rhodobacterales bacterium CG2_30_65_12]